MLGNLEIQAHPHAGYWVDKQYAVHGTHYCRTLASQSDCSCISPTCYGSSGSLQRLLSSQLSGEHTPNPLSPAARCCVVLLLAQSRSLQFVQTGLRTPWPADTQAHAHSHAHMHAHTHAFTHRCLKNCSERGV